MALNLTKFKKDLKSAMKSAAQANAQLEPKNAEQALDKAMENISNAIAEQVDAYIKTLKLTIPTGGVVVTQTTASPSPQSNANPIVIENGVS